MQKGVKRKADTTTPFEGQDRLSPSAKIPARRESGRPVKKTAKGIYAEDPVKVSKNFFKISQIFKSLSSLCERHKLGDDLKVGEKC